MSTEYKVGRNRPPKSSRFKKGVSGNPKGRPKGSRNFATDLKDELADKIVVNESGAKRRLTKQQALIKTLMARALQGDAKAAAALLNMILRLDLAAQEAPVNAGPDDDLVLRRFAPRVIEMLKKQVNAKK